MDKHIARGDSAWYAAHIEDFVGRIDAFVLALQHYSEHKIQTVTLLSGWRPRDPAADAVYPAAYPPPGRITAE